MAKWKQQMTSATNRANWEVTRVSVPWWHHQPCLSQPGPHVSPCLTHPHPGWSQLPTALPSPATGPAKPGPCSGPSPGRCPMPGAGAAPVLLSTSTWMEVPWLNHSDDHRKSQNVFTDHSYKHRYLQWRVVRYIFYHTFAALFHALHFKFHLSPNGIVVLDSFQCI